MNPEQTSFLMPLGAELDPTNRWVRLARLVPWEVATEAYDRQFARRRGGPTPLSGRIALGSLIIKERLSLTDEETVEQIRENPYLQYFLGFASYRTTIPFDDSMLTHFRKRLGVDTVQAVNEALIGRAESAASTSSDDDVDPPPPSDTGEQSDPDDGQQSSAPAPDGALLIDATCTPADLTYPTDLKILDQARRITEAVIDRLHEPHRGVRRKPLTYRQCARRDFLRSAKAKRQGARKRRTAAGKQLRYLRRNLATIAAFVAEDGGCLRLLDRVLYRKLLVAHLVYDQQLLRFETGTTSIPNRIVSIAQPHIRPIVRGKAAAPTEFGAKISASLTGNGLAALDRLEWDAYNECADLTAQAEAYRKRTGHYPKVIYADRIYRTRANRAWCKEHGIRLAGLAPGRPPTDPDKLKQRRRQARDDEAARQPIEGLFGRGKRRFSLNRIMTKLATTSAVSISLVFLVLNLEHLLGLCCALVFLALAWSRYSMARSIVSSVALTDVAPLPMAQWSWWVSPHRGEVVQ